VKPLLSTRELCKLLRISESTLYKKLKTDPTFPRPLRDLGRNAHFRPEQIEEWVDARTRAATAPAQG
jgi:predicted DNA-binding transcriptional regulator AlpA